MRVLTIPLLLFVAGSAKVCDSDDKAPPQPSAAASASAQADVNASAAAAVAVRPSAALTAPRIGGSVVAVGDFSVELVVHASGLVEAFVSDAQAALVSDGVKLDATVQAKGGVSEKVALAFVAPHARFEGHAKAGIELVTGPVELALEVGGKLHAGKLELALALPAPRHGGQLVAAGDFAIELVAKGPELRAFVLDASGKAHVAGDLKLMLDVGARADTAIELKWDAPSLSYVGTATAQANLALEPLRLSLSAAGKAFVAGVASLDANAKAHANLKAKLDTDVDAKVAAGAGAKAKVDAAAKADLSKAASGSVKVTPPKLDVSAGAKAGGGAKAGAGAKAGGGAKAGVKIGF